MGAESGGTRRSVQPRPPGAVLHAVVTQSCLPGAAPPLRGWGAQRAPLYGDAGEQLVQPRAERMRTLCPRRCPALPGVLLQLTAHGHAGPVAGQPDLWGNLLPCRRATPSSRPLPAPSSIFCFREAVGLARGSCRRATGLVATGPKGQGSIWLQGTAGYWPMAGYKRVPWRCLTAGRKRRDGRPPRWLTGWPKSRSGAGAHGARPLQLCCAVQSSLAPAWPSWVLAAGKGAGISTFGGYFQVLERSRGEMRLSPRRPEKQGPALGNGGLQGEGREGLSTRPRAHT